MNNQKTYLLYLDVIRFLAAFMVVFIHTAAPILYNIETTSHWNWMIANFYDGFSRISVPLFVMISGSLLLNKEEPYLIFFKKRFTRLAFPFIFWILVYLLWQNYKDHQIFSITHTVLLILKGPVYYHLWFVYMLIGLYVITPLIRKFVQRLNSKDFFYLFTLMVIFNSILPIISAIFSTFLGKQIEFGIKIPEISLYLGYYLFGYYLKTKELSKENIHRIAILFITSTFFTIWITYILSLKVHSFYGLFYDYYSPSVMVSAVTFFLLVKYYVGLYQNTIPSLIQKWIKRLSDLGLGIYLIHALILDQLIRGTYGVVIDVTKLSPLFGIPFVVLVVFILSALITYLFKKIPLLKSIV